MHGTTHADGMAAATASCSNLMAECMKLADLAESARTLRATIESGSVSLSSAEVTLLGCKLKRLERGAIGLYRRASRVVKLCRMAISARQNALGPSMSSLEGEG